MFYQLNEFIESVESFKNNSILLESYDRTDQDNMPECLRASITRDRKHLVISGHVFETYTLKYVGCVSEPAGYNVIAEQIFETEDSDYDTDAERSDYEDKEMTFDQDKETLSSEDPDVNKEIQGAKAKPDSWFYSVLEAIESFAYSDAGMVFDTILTLTGVGEAVTWVVWGIVTGKAIWDYTIDDSFENLFAICSAISGILFAALGKLFKSIGGWIGKLFKMKPGSGESVGLIRKLKNFLMKNEKVMEFFNSIDNIWGGIVKKIDDAFEYMANKSNALIKNLIIEPLTKVKNKIMNGLSKYKDKILGFIKKMKDTIFGDMRLAGRGRIIRSKIMRSRIVKFANKKLIKKIFGLIKTGLKKLTVLIFKVLAWLFTLNLKDLASVSNIGKYIHMGNFTKYTPELKVTQDIHYIVYSTEYKNDYQIYADDILDFYNEHKNFDIFINKPNVNLFYSILIGIFGARQFVDYLNEKGGVDSVEYLLLPVVDTEAYTNSVLPITFTPDFLKEVRLAVDESGIE